MSVRRLGLMVGVIVLVLGGIFLWTGRAPVSSAQPAVADESPARTITVVGHGEVNAKPDVAYTTVGVEMRAQTVEAAAAQTEERMAAILAALKGLGLADKDIQTSNFSINFERDGSEESAGYFRVSNMVRVTVRDLSQVGAVLDAAIKAGANSVWGMNFGLDKTEELQIQAREAAVRDAKARAESLAALHGVGLGSVIAVSELAGSSPVLVEASMKFGSGASVEPGEVTFSTQIQAVYAIE